MRHDRCFGRSCSKSFGASRSQGHRLEVRRGAVPARALRLGQVHLPALHQPPGADRRRAAIASTASSSATAQDGDKLYELREREVAAQRARDRHGLPALQPLPAPDRARERHRGAGAGHGRAARPGRGAARDAARPGRPRRQARRLPGSALRRPAAARGDRPRARHGPEAHAVRRADLRARPRARRRGPRRHEGAGRAA